MENDENKNNSSKTINTSKSSLGLVSLPDQTFEHDLAVGKLYQDFSAELLRLSLAGIGAIGFLLTNIFLIKREDNTPEVSRNLVFYALLCFGVAAGLALLHRYFGPDSKAYHLEYIRREESLRLKGEKPDDSSIEKFFGSAYLYFKGIDSENDGVSKARDTKYIRNFLLRVCSWLLFLSGLFLWIGSMLLIWAFKSVIYYN